MGFAISVDLIATEKQKHEATLAEDYDALGQNTPIQLHNTSGASSPSLAKEAENSSLR